MTDLTKDLHIGKKFSRHDELRERERQSRLKSKVKKVLGDTSRDGSEVPEASPGDPSVKSKSATPTALSTPAPAPASGPQFRIVDGQIIIDQSSLVMDRHARAAATRGDMETVEENDFTRLITSSSFMNTSKLKGPNIWTEEETELFYRGLRMFGTEFEMISRMFPNKQRRHVKLKYNREERHCPHLLTAALVGEKTVQIDIEEYKAFTGIEFESVESIEAEQRKIQDDFEAEQKRVADEQAEIMRKKREELFADEDGNEDGSGKKKKKGKKKGKQAVKYGLNGEPIIAGES
jgi:transcription factor TFIIIB component B''